MIILTRSNFLYKVLSESVCGYSDNSKCLCLTQTFQFL
nr:MAG TPA: hypothetical protein [Caudoviricetes sp.]